MIVFIKASQFTIRADDKYDREKVCSVVVVLIQ